MKLRLIVVGKDRKDPLVLAADEYLSRVRRYYPIELLELKEEPLKKNTPVDYARRAEAARIDAALGERARFVALDERGQDLSSKAISEKLERFTHEGAGINFVIGGPSGLDRKLLERAHARWRLSSLTLPHRMARLVLCEQLYRACTIIRGEPYHK